MFLTLKTEIEGRFRDLESLFKGTVDLKGQHQKAYRVVPGYAGFGVAVPS